ncbi:hypothetical protein FI667_g3376, partial [Globisporangium splendens]
MTHWTDDGDCGAMLAAALAFVDEYESSMVASDSGDDALPHSLVSASAAQGELVLDGLAAIDEQVDVRTVDANASNTGSSLLPVALVPLDGNNSAIQQDARTSLTAKKSCKKPTRSDPNKSRNARKQELIYLRSKVSDLEAQLRDMHKQKHPRDSPSSSSLWHRIHSAEERNDQDLRFSIPLSAAGSSFRPTAASVWKEIADSQSNERMRSERENTRLKLLLGSQLRIANNLQKLLNKSIALRDIEKCVYRSKGVQNVHSPTSDWTVNQVFESLLAGVHATYSEIDALLAAISLARSEAPHVAAKMLTDESHGQVMEVFGNKVFPFDIQTTGTAVWNHFLSAKERVPYRHYYHTTPKEINAEEDTILENCILEMQLNQVIGQFRLKQILRRYVERDRVVVIWLGCFNPIELSGEPITGVQFVEKGFIVVKRPKINWGNMSLLQTCYITKPELTGDMKEKENPLVKSMLDFVLRTTAGNITASHQMIENELLEQMLRTIKKLVAIVNDFALSCHGSTCNQDGLVVHQRQQLRVSQRLVLEETAQFVCCVGHAIRISSVDHEDDPSGMPQHAKYLGVRNATLCQAETAHQVGSLLMLYRLRTVTLDATQSLKDYQSPARTPKHFAPHGPLAVKTRCLLAQALDSRSFNRYTDPAVRRKQSFIFETQLFLESRFKDLDSNLSKAVRFCNVTRGVAPEANNQVVDSVKLTIVNNVRKMVVASVAEEIAESVTPEMSTATDFSEKLMDMFGSGTVQDSVNVADVRESRVEEELQRWVVDFERLPKVAKTVFGFATSSAQIERDFGGCGRLVTSHRVSLGDLSVEMSSFPNCNREFIQLSQCGKIPVDTIAAHIPSHVLVGIGGDLDNGVDREIIQTFSSASFDDEEEERAAAFVLCV